MIKNNQTFSEYKREVGQRMRDILVRVGLTAADVVRNISGWGYSRLGNYLNGINLANPPDMRKFTKACGVEGCEQWIYYGDTRSSPPPRKKPVGKQRKTKS